MPRSLRRRPCWPPQDSRGTSSLSSSAFIFESTPSSQVRPILGTEPGVASQQCPIRKPWRWALGWQERPRETRHEKRQYPNQTTASGLLRDRPTHHKTLHRGRYPLHRCDMLQTALHRCWFPRAIKSSQPALCDVQLVEFPWQLQTGDHACRCGHAAAETHPVVCSRRAR